MQIAVLIMYIKYNIISRVFWYLKQEPLHIHTHLNENICITQDILRVIVVNVHSDIIMHLLLNEMKRNIEGPCLAICKHHFHVSYS